jgi:fructokinase
MNIACVGEMVIDFLPGEEEGVYIRKPGGAPANVAVAVARNSLSAGFCGCLGNDDFGRFLVKTLEDNNVAVLRPQLLDEAITTMAFVTLDQNKDRSFTFVRKPGADQFLSREDIDRGKVAQGDIIHAGSCSLSKPPASDATVYAMECAKKNGKLVSFDINYRNLMWEDDRAACCKAVQDILPLVDFLKLSEEEGDMLGTEPSKAGETYGIALVVESLGAKGARCYWKGKRLTVAGRKAHCVDATGAGDAFWGGFLSCLLRANVKTTDDITEPLLQKALEYGNVAGWLCVQKKGAMESLPTIEEIEAILEV